MSGQKNRKRKSKRRELVITQWRKDLYSRITSERRELSWSLRLKALKFKLSYRHETAPDLLQQRRVEASKSEVMNSTPSHRIREIIVEFWVNTKKRSIISYLRKPDWPMRPAIIPAATSGLLLKHTFYLYMRKLYKTILSLALKQWFSYRHYTSSRTMSMQGYDLDLMQNQMGYLLITEIINKRKMYMNLDPCE